MGVLRAIGMSVVAAAILGVGSVFLAAEKPDVAFMDVGETRVPSSDSLTHKAQKREERILFVGDILLDRSLRRGSVSEYKEVFGPAIGLFSEHDLVMGNLEGPITSEESVSVGTLPAEEGNMTFTFPRVAAEALRAVGVDIVSIGNNHILDFGYHGLGETKHFLDVVGVRYVGDPSVPGEILHMFLGNRRIAFISENEFLGSKEATRAAIATAAQEEDFVVVYAHWGEEYVLQPPDYVVKRAHALVDAGASLVIGSHPHVVEPYEDYRASRIYYSLGNFLFDQYWDDSVRTGLAVSVTMDDDGVSYEEYDVHMAAGGVVNIEKRISDLPSYRTDVQ